MISGLKPKKLLYKDGTGQSQRMMPALDPGSINIDERSLSDLIGFAQEFSKQLVFFDEDNNLDKNWEAFLAHSFTKGDGDNASLKKQFLTELLTYINNPATFSGDEEKMRRFSQPHLILFVSFLQLLGLIKEQLNGLTKKHLDFYYLEVLGLNKKKPVPDVANVIIDLADNVNGLLVEKGTLLSAGKDSLGKDLVYKTDKDIAVSQARVGDIKTIFVEKKVTTLKDARANIVTNEEDAFMTMLQLALGDPDIADELPLYHNAPVGYKELDSIYNGLKDKDDPLSDQFKYITEKLFLAKAELIAIIDTYRGKNSTGEDWEKVYGYLDHAFKEKTKWKRQQSLRNIKDKNVDPVKGFSDMMEFALGDPDPGDKLPIYKGKTVNIYELYDDFKSQDNTAKKEASEYIKDELLLSENDFTFSIKTATNSKASAQDWDKVYAIIELAQRKKRKYQLPSPYVEEWLNVYSVNDAKANGYKIDAGGGDSTSRFNTFGSKSSQEIITQDPANIGFGISSSQLKLAEGKRTITLTISFKKDGIIDVEEIKNQTTLLTDSIQYFQPFLFFISNTNGWVSIVPKADSLRFGDVIVNASSQVLSAQIVNDTITTRNETPFVQDDLGRYIVWMDGTIYQIAAVINATSATLKPAGKMAKQEQVKKYNSSDIFFDALQVILELNENDPPITAPGPGNDYINIKSSSPVIAMVLNQVPLLREGKINQNDYGRYINLYQQFKNLQLQKVKVKVEVSNLKALLLQNDFSVLDYKKPFEPFGFSPASGNHFYFTHPELGTKQLDKLNLKFEWMKPPKSFQDYYKNYWTIISSSADLTATYGDHQVTDNWAFESEMKFVDNSAIIPLGKTKLFNKDNAQTDFSIDINIAQTISTNRPGYTYARSNASVSGDEVLNNRRYFSLELGATDFQHSIYSTVLTAQAFLNPVIPATSTEPSKPNPLRAITLNTPYTPKLKSVTASYNASLEVNFTNNVANNIEDTVYHINAFGYKQLITTGKNISANNTYFLPYLKNEGELYIGLAKLTVPQNISVLFEMAEGSANPDVEKQPVLWSYMSNNEWQELKSTNIVSDATNGLVNTGIIEINIPADATNNNTVLNSGLHWLKAAVRNNTAAISDTVDIVAQATSATFVDNENAQDHLLTLLEPGTIASTVDRVTDIKQIRQPFSSSKGRPGETDLFFYNRVSERLRHKNRAVTMWDYERIVLEQFPGIYKVKCIPAEFDGVTIEAGRVDVIVIPDIKGKLPFNPFQPKVPAETILQVQKFLEQKVPAFATVKVKNPAYLQLKARFAVKFKVGYNEGFYSAKLEEELKKFLAPWAYDVSADIMIGGRIYANVIVNFLAERSYVEYVAGIKLFQSKDGISFIDVRTLNNGQNVIKADSPDIILVSALNHDIDIITEEGFEENDFTGINYMRIGLDFIVA